MSFSASLEGKTGEEFLAAVAGSAVSGAVAGAFADLLLVTGGSAAVVIALGAAGGAAGVFWVR